MYLFMPRIEITCTLLPYLAHLLFIRSVSVIIHRPVSYSPLVMGEGLGSSCFVGFLAELSKKIDGL